MGAERKKQHIALPVALAAGLLLFLVVGGICFSRYLKQQIYEERTNQLVEITSQVQTKKVRQSINVPVNHFSNFINCSIATFWLANI